MSFGDTIRLAFRNLGQAKLRTALTVLGVSIGIASLSGMVSLGVGLQDQVVGRFAQSGMFDSITVASAGRFGGQGLRGRGGRRGQPSPAPAPRGRSTLAIGEPDADEQTDARARLDDDAVKKFAELPDVKAVYPSLQVGVQVKLEDFTEFRTAAGVPMSAKSEGGFQSIAHGAFFANETDDACMVSLDFANRLATDPKTLIGKTLTLSYAVSTQQPGTKAEPLPAGIPGIGLEGLQVRRVEAPCPIVGIIERESAPGLGGAGSVSALMLPMAKVRAIYAVQVTSAQSLLRGPRDDRQYPTITVKVSSPKHTQEVEDKIKALGYSAFSLNDLLQGAKRAFILIDIILGLIGSIALAVSSLGIVNTMVMSILERTREIGVMKAIGGSDRDVRKIFLIEAATIGVMGGLAGIALGWVVGRIINFGANVYVRSQGVEDSSMNLFSLPLWLVAGAIGFSVLMSLLAGSYPARRAARLDPIQALRHD